MFPGLADLATTADKLGDAATDIASRVESIESLLREQNAMLAMRLRDDGGADMDDETREWLSAIVNREIRGE